MTSLKRRFLILIIGVMLFVNFSCMKLFIISQGFKFPYFETKESLQSYMKSNSIDFKNAYYGKDSLSQIKLQKVNDKYGKILTFNNAGVLQVYSEKKTCPGPVENYLNGICNRTAISTDSLITLQKIIRLLKPISENNNSEISMTADYTFIIYWAVYFDKHNQELINWNKIIQKQEGDCNINVLFVNCDYRANDFGYTERKKVKANYHPVIPSN